METTSIPRWERRVTGFVVRTVFLRGRRGGPWPIPKELAAEPISFEGNTGADVRGHWFPTPSDEPRGVVVLVHPDRRYGQHWFVRTGWIEWLQAHGFDALTFDLPGYGASTGPARYYHEDVEAAVAYADHHGGALPVHVVGLSLGAFAATNAAPYLDGVSALVLESPYPSFNAWYGGGWGLAAMRAWDRLFPRTSAAIQALDNAPRARADRVLVVGSAADATTPVRLTREVADALPSDRTTYLELDGIDHLGFFEASGAYRSAVLATLLDEDPSGAFEGGGGVEARQASSGARTPSSAQGEPPALRSPR